MLLRPVVRDGKPGLLGNVYGMTIVTGSAQAAYAPSGHVYAPLPSQASPPPPQPSQRPASA
ncbi:MAG TPA: hypothetical protein VMI11_04455 [Actinomycetes bacterium]|nr:hypothetical protein [Actinomycetes bacterium]